MQQKYSNQEYGTGTKKKKDQWNKIETSEINSGTYGQSVTNEARIYSGEKTIYSINGAGKTGPATCRRTKSEYSLTPNTVHKNQLKMG